MGKKLRQGEEGDAQHPERQLMVIRVGDKDLGVADAVLELAIMHQMVACVQVLVDQGDGDGEYALRRRPGYAGQRVHPGRGYVGLAVLFAPYD